RRARRQDTGRQQSVRRAGPRHSRSRQGGQAERQCRRRRRNQCARQGGGAGRQKGAVISAALCRRRGVPRSAEGGAGAGAVLKWRFRRRSSYGALTRVSIVVRKKRICWSNSGTAARGFFST